MSETFDLQAAWIRKSQGDIKAFFEALAASLEAGFPGQVEVRRKKDGIFSKTSHVEGLSIRTQNYQFHLEREGAGLRAIRAREVRGVVLKRDDLAIGEWLESLTRELAGVSGDLVKTRDALHDFLMS